MEHAPDSVIKGRKVCASGRTSVDGEALMKKCSLISVVLLLFIHSITLMYDVYLEEEKKDKEKKEK